MTARVLAGDIGGTKTLLALYSAESPGKLVLLRETEFASRSYGGLEDVLAEFLGSGGERVAAAAFGIAGPVLEGAVVTTNLPWRVEAAALGRVLHCEQVKLLNDLESTAYGALFLAPSEISTLQQGQPRRGNCAVIAAGTGLGQAFLFWDGERYHPAATEGGHADFAPRSDLEVDLLRFLARKYSRVSYERVLSGPGLLNVFTFLDEGLKRPVEPAVRRRMQTEDASAVVGGAGVAGACATCAEAVDIFLSLYGAQAGNLALSVMAVGGVYVGGGIITKMLPKIGSSGFMQSFTAKGRYARLLSEIPVRIILNPEASLLGAAHAAAEVVGGWRA